MKNFIVNPKKYFINVILYILLATCLFFLITQQYLKLSGYTFSILLIIFPYYLYARSPKVRSALSKNFIETIQLVTAIVCFFNLLGSLNFYTNPDIWWYDTVIHFISPVIIFSITPFLAILFQKHFFGKVYLSITLIGNFLLVILGSFFWEFFESSVDTIFTSASMFGQFGEIYYDTVTDLAADFTGGLMATWLIYRYFYGYILDNTIRHSQKYENK